MGNCHHFGETSPTSTALPLCAFQVRLHTQGICLVGVGVRIPSQTSLKHQLWHLLVLKAVFITQADSWHEAFYLSTF